MDQKPNKVWDVLVSKANIARQSKQNALDNLRKIKQQTIDRQNKIDRLLNEYQTRMEAMQQESHSNVEADNHRNFIFQLMDIQNRTTAELAKLDNDMIEARGQLLTSERECLKADYLAKRHHDEIANASALIERKDTDALGLMQFNMNSLR